MPNNKETIVEAMYRKALELACERIADSGQTYEEANTTEGWVEHFLEKATV